MTIFFFKIIEISIIASYITFLILIIRKLFHKISKRYLCLLWSFVGLRLLLPFEIKSSLSLIPKETFITSNSTIVNVISHSQGVIHTQAISELNKYNMFVNVWIIGIIVMIIYLIGSMIIINLKVKDSIYYKDNIYINNSIDTAFILGIIKPKIYIPNTVNEIDLNYMIKHEKNHIKRKDHFWKPLGYLLLTIHWFNPMIWIAYIYLCKDIELACDEEFVEKMDTEKIKEYMSTLLKYSVSRNNIISCPLAFGEIGIKERIKAMMNYKKKNIWMKFSIIFIVLFISVGCMTNPKITEKNIINTELQDKMSKLSEELNILQIRLDIMNNFRLPVDNVQLTCTWECFENHKGYDLINKIDRYGDVVSVSNGEVIAVGEDKNEGYFIEIQHDNGVISHYGTLGEILVEKGQQVKQSDVIAKLGMSGRATGPHVHFYLMYDNYILQDSYDLIK